MNFLGENTNIVLVIAGLFLTAAGAVIEKLAPEERRITRAALVGIAIFGFGVTAYASWMQELDNRQQKQKTATVDAQIGQLLGSSSDEYNQINAKLSAIEAKVGEIAPTHTGPLMKLAEPTQAEYFVQIAASNSLDLLQSLAQKLAKTYNLPTDFAVVLNIPGPSPYKLAFGQHLDKPTAEKYAALANNLNLPPPGQSAWVRPQPK